ncbi:T9SS type A sorting domain-containing protein [Ulvibacter litoralis]|uniref:Por secretion system C-terminal sorting domain-containing protein n=1 Tax=Ulvibacter litoralis TaxID=227084 RepID=A0A1G7F3Q3_9FLAO|nr:T9SS type A sorting domain-containing protein [Ulvibacter litoralis]GHC52809.1 hypothetical protein GCM10008083_15930 [Ulvibacter litoralis]SDE70472.1 Por secretion system C-terminal sorting domain-containing protein [Ulvibacter litoralis]
MKKITLVFMALLASIASAQTTFDLDWAIGITGAAASVTIEPGDTVRWTWTDSQPHTVTNIAGSTETFDSGILTGVGEQFSFTFTDVGANNYQCDVHPGMNGTITVDDVASIDDKFKVNINFYPNPVQDKLMVTSLFQLDTYKIYTVLGELVSKGAATGNVTEINTAALEAGLYFVNTTSGELQSTFKIVKQ